MNQRIDTNTLLRFQAGALSYTLFVAVIASLLLSALVLGAFYHKLEGTIYEVGIKNNNSIVSATALALALDDVAYQEPWSGALFSEGTDSAEITKQPWGAWDIFKVAAIYSGGEQVKHFRKGYTRSDKGESALYLVDGNRPVSVAGQTKITGDAYLPKAGIRSAILAGVGYQNRELLYGEKLVSKDEMPALNGKRMSLLTQFSKGQINALYPGDMVLKDLPGNQTMPFSRDSVIFNTGSSITLKDTLRGRIWIHAAKKIFIDSTAFLKDVILSAPIIEIDSGFDGSLQVIATDTILVRGGAQLTYPSFLAVLNERPPATIQLEHDASVKGVILMHGDEKQFNQRVMQIADNAVVEGKVYCDGLLDTNGDIKGHVSTRKFLINTFSGVFENYIFNTQLDATAIHPEFVGTDLWFNSEERRVLEWLY